MRCPAAQIFFLAGMETTAHAATWALFQLLQRPEVEARVAAELDAAGLLITRARPSPRALEHADLAGPHVPAGCYQGAQPHHPCID